MPGPFAFHGFLFLTYTGWKFFNLHEMLIDVAKRKFIQSVSQLLFCSFHSPLHRPQDGFAGWAESAGRSCSVIYISAVAGEFTIGGWESGYPKPLNMARSWRFCFVSPGSLILPKIQRWHSVHAANPVVPE
jgi:hypothetical protein